MSSLYSSRRRRLESPVEATRAQKETRSWRRSPPLTGLRSGSGVSTRRLPQEWQKVALGAASVPQLGQRWTKGAPQWAQNLAPEGVGWPQAAQLSGLSTAMPLAIARS